MDWTLRRYEETTQSDSNSSFDVPALPDAVPPSRSRSPDNSIFVLQVAKSDPKARWTTDHIPDKLRQAFIYLMVPHARIVAGSGKPWASLTISQVQVLFNEVYNRRITKPYKIVPHDVYSTLISYRINDWRNKIATSAVAALKKVIAVNTAQQGTDPDEKHPIPYDGPHRLELIKEWIAFQLGDRDKRVPFHWGRWNRLNDKRSGTFQSELILRTFASGHLALFADLNNREDPWVEKQWPGDVFPCGALVLCIQAVERALLAFESGEFVKKTGHEAHFSEDNWGDKIVIVDGKKVKLPRASKYMRLVKAWSPMKWNQFIKLAWGYEEAKAGRQKGYVDDEDEEAEESDGSENEMNLDYESDINVSGTSDVE